MKRAAPLTRTRMARGKDRGVPPKVRAQVRARSRGLCEVGAGWSCGVDSLGDYTDPATDLHHLVKRPRLHEPWAIVHLCRRHHEMCEAPYNKGRLVFGFTYSFTAGLADDSIPFELACASAASVALDTIEMWWAIEVRARKDGPLLHVLAEGRIAL